MLRFTIPSAAIKHIVKFFMAMFMLSSEENYNPNLKELSKHYPFNDSSSRIALAFHYREKYTS